MSSFQEPTDSDFGRRDYWNDLYKDSLSSDATDSKNDEKDGDGGNHSGTTAFSWYSGWDDLQPFLEEHFLLGKATRILLPGVGNDPLLRDLYDAGYHNLVAFDYAPEGVARAKELLGPDRMADVRVFCGDARDLSEEETASYDCIIEKGTLDAIHLAGGKDKQKGAEYVEMAIQEFARLTKPGGTGHIISITAACVDAVKEGFEQQLLKDDGKNEWTVVRDGDFFVTDDGFTSNNIDGTYLVYRKA